MSKPNTQALKAIYIAVLCFVSYIAVSIARNILGTVTPQMIESGTFTASEIGILSSVYFIVYAVGQLINGIIGDKIKAKYMIGFGLIFAGISNTIFIYFHESNLTAYAAYAMVGFFVSMIYGSMAKTVAENLEPLYATRCSILYVFIAFMGSPLAGILAALMAWEAAFQTSSALLFIMAILVFILYYLYEKRGIVKFGEYVPKEKGIRNISILIRYRIIRFTIVSAITGIIRTTVVFWLPTYIAQYLGYSAEHSALLFTIVTVFISASAFISLFVYEKIFRSNMDRTILAAFITASVSFLGVYLIPQTAVNLAFMTLAILASNCAATITVSRYCPSLKETGFVSSAAGYLDFISYIAAAAASAIFADAINSIGWKGLIIIWFLLTASGIITMAIKKKGRSVNV